MWSAEDVARDQVRRQANGLGVAALAEKVTEADRRRQETARDARLGVSAAFEDVERLAETWAAKSVHRCASFLPLPGPHRTLDVSLRGVDRPAGLRHHVPDAPPL
ncbi:hypothetical protein [Streptomyces kronopolitis]|uniref:hypothetical protein n=1 Tax=Streptomyces kronopolitis TaxID=1612435 RepID=UPI003D95E15B